MSLPEFSSTKRAVFFLLALGVAVAGVFGFGEFELSTEAAELIEAAVAAVAALWGLYSTISND